jgi:hypothetical protein
MLLQTEANRSSSSRKPPAESWSLSVSSRYVVHDGVDRDPGDQLSVAVHDGAETRS